MKSIIGYILNMIPYMIITIPIYLIHIIDFGFYGQ